MIRGDAVSEGVDAPVGVFDAVRVCVWDDVGDGVLLLVGVDESDDEGVADQEVDAEGVPVDAAVIEGVGALEEL